MGGAQVAKLSLVFVILGALLVAHAEGTLCGGSCATSNSYNSNPLVPGGHVLHTCKISIQSLPTNPTWPILIYFQNQKLSCNKYSATPQDSVLSITNPATLNNQVTSYRSGWSCSAPSNQIGGVLNPNNELFMTSHIQPITGSGWENQQVTWTGDFTSSEPGLVFTVSWSAAQYAQGFFSNSPTDTDYNSLGINVYPGLNRPVGTPSRTEAKTYLNWGACGGGVLNYFTYLCGSVFSSPYQVKDLCKPGVKGEPHFTGGDGVNFDWSGHPNKNYCLISDENMHINIGMTGHFSKWGRHANHSLTWTQKIAYLWSNHSLVLVAREGASPEPLDGYMASMKYDGVEFSLAPGKSVEFDNEYMKVSYLSNKYQDGDELIDLYEVSIRGLVTMRLKLRPEVAHLRTPENAWIHFDFDMPYAKLTSYAHGVLGQTFRPDFRIRSSKVKQVWNEQLQWYQVPGDNAEGYLDGHFSHYEEPSMTSSSCKYSRFHRNLIEEPKVFKTKSTSFSSNKRIVSVGQKAKTISVTRKLL